MANIAIIAFAIDGLVALNAWQFVGAWQSGLQCKEYSRIQIPIFVQQEKIHSLVNTELRKEIAENFVGELWKSPNVNFQSMVFDDKRYGENLVIEFRCFFTITESVLTVLLSIGVILTYHWSILLFCGIN